MRPVVDDAVELEVQQFAGTHPGRPQQREAAQREGILEPGDGGHEVSVGVWTQRTRHGVGQSGQIGQEDEPALRSSRPTPLRDVLEEGAQIDDVVMEYGHPHRLVTTVSAPPRPSP